MSLSSAIRLVPRLVSMGRFAVAPFAAETQSCPSCGVRVASAVFASIEPLNGGGFVVVDTGQFYELDDQGNLTLDLHKCR